MEPFWWLTKDGDVNFYELFIRHYSSGKNRNRRIRQCVGPGETIVLRTDEYDAGFVWRKFIDDCIDERTGERQQGVNCAVFRNDNAQAYLSSEFVRQADAIADLAWSGERHYTYIDPTKIRSTNPGFCFIAAGWRRCGITKRGLIILEKLPIALEKTAAIV